MRTLIKNATCLLPTGPEVGHVLLEDGRIAGVGAPATVAADEVVDATGLHLLPGVIDDQVHFREPGATHKEDLHTGSLACAKGGVTSFLDMPNNNPPVTTVARLEAKLQLAARKCVVNHGFYVGATADNVVELARAVRTPGIKVFMGSSTGDLLVDEQSALERIFAETTLPIATHAEDEATMRANQAALGPSTEVADHSRVRNHEVALIATRRAMDLALRHKHRLHVLHVSTAAEPALLKEHGGLVTGEVCPHHLLFNTTDYARLGTLVQMNPALKDPADNEGLWQALRQDWLQVVATDHAPHTLEEKQQPFPNAPSGLPAVENLLPLMLDAAHRGLCTLEQVVHWLCDAPARVWDMVGKGRLVEGYDADVVLVDLNATRTVRNADQVTRCGWTPWDGTELTGWPTHTWVGGRLVYAEGKVDAEARGRELLFDHARGGYWATQGDS